jgi:hypothetical protein
MVLEFPPVAAEPPVGAFPPVVDDPPVAELPPRVELPPAADVPLPVVPPSDELSPLAEEPAELDLPPLSDEPPTPPSSHPKAVTIPARTKQRANIFMGNLPQGAESIRKERLEIPLGATNGSVRSERNGF